mmetsp:Transcript_89689/g.231502  ORF Transcript_89689/g.231502 Transcript_89689/m.231502 type:complete len:571 (-) Transcript_89689:548-2260(-)
MAPEVRDGVMHRALQVLEADGKGRVAPVRDEVPVVVEARVRQEPHLHLARVTAGGRVLEPALEGPDRLLGQLLAVSSRHPAAEGGLDHRRRRVHLGALNRDLQPRLCRILLEGALDHRQLRLLFLQTLLDELAEDALAAHCPSAVHGLDLRRRLAALPDLVPCSVEQVLGDAGADVLDLLDALAGQHASCDALDGNGSVVAGRLCGDLLEEVLELAGAAAPGLHVGVDPRRNPELEGPGLHAAELVVLRLAERELHGLLGEHLLSERPPCEEDLGLALDQARARREAREAQSLHPPGRRTHPDAALDGHRALEHVLEAGLLPGQIVDVLAVPEATVDGLDLGGRLRLALLPDPHHPPLHEHNPDGGLDLRRFPAQESAVLHARSELLARQEATDASLDLLRGAVPAVRRRLREHELLGAARASLLHAQAQLPAQRLRALLHRGLLPGMLDFPLGDDDARHGLDLDQTLDVVLLLFLLAPPQLNLLMRGLLRTWGTSQERKPLLHLGHHPNPLVEVVIHSHARVVKPALVRLPVVEELLAMLVEELHPVSEVFPDVLLELGNLVLDLPEAT